MRRRVHAAVLQGRRAGVFIVLANKGNVMYNRLMEMQAYTGGPVACNGYLLKGPGGYVAIDAPEGFARWALEKAGKGGIRHLLLTHQHFDHVQDAAALQAATGCAVHAFSPYNRDLTLAENARAWGIPEPEPYRVDDAFGSGSQRADWGGFDWRLLYIPGHSADGMAYGLPGENAVFVGDILFAGAVGRTDFPGGSMERLMRGIREKLLALPSKTQVFSGHGPSTTLQEELAGNPYL